MQLCLFDQRQAPPAPRAVRRIDLEGAAGLADPWVEHWPLWLARPSHAFELLRSSGRWEQHRRTMYDRIVEVPRLVAGDPRQGKRCHFRDGQITWSGEPRCCPSEASELLGGLAAHLSNAYGRRLTRVMMAQYRNGADSVAWHGDKLGELRADTVVAILSLGGPRRLLMRPQRPSRAWRGSTASRARGSSTTLSFNLESGDLLVMGGSCQQTWEHCVPKVRHAQPRIALMFRETASARESPSVAATSSG